MKVRTCNQSDAPAIAALAVELGYPNDAAQVAPRLASLMARQDDTVLVAEVDAADGGAPAGAVVGWLHLREERSVVSEPVAEIAGFVVASSHRGRGIGKALLAAAVAWAEARGIGRVRVHSNMVRTEAHSWYRAAGFALQKTQGVLIRNTV
jgi:GNAT superfamily N-acetyltransferase